MDRLKQLVVHLFLNQTTVFKNLNKIGQKAFALVLGPHNDTNIYSDWYFLKPLFWAHGFLFCFITSVSAKNLASNFFTIKMLSLYIVKVRNVNWLTHNVLTSIVSTHFTTNKLYLKNNQHFWAFITKYCTSIKRDRYRVSTHTLTQKLKHNMIVSGKCKYVLGWTLSNTMQNLIICFDRLIKQNMKLPTVKLIP